MTLRSGMVRSGLAGHGKARALMARKEYNDR